MSSNGRGQLFSQAGSCRTTRWKLRRIAWDGSHRSRRWPSSHSQRSRAGSSCPSLGMCRRSTGQGDSRRPSWPGKRSNERRRRAARKDVRQLTMSSRHSRVIQGYFRSGSPRIPEVPPPFQPRAAQPSLPAPQPGSPWSHQQRMAQLKAGSPHQGQPRPLASQASLGPVVQRLGNGGAFQLPASMANFVNGGGQPLPNHVREKMEAAFGARFDNVRVHVGPEADSLGALAFTHGSDVYFAPGRATLRRHGQLLSHGGCRAAARPGSVKPFASGGWLQIGAQRSRRMGYGGLPAKTTSRGASPAPPNPHPIRSLHRHAAGDPAALFTGRRPPAPPPRCSSAGVRPTTARDPLDAAQSDRRGRGPTPRSP